MNKRLSGIVYELIYDGSPEKTTNLICEIVQCRGDSSSLTVIWFMYVKVLFSMGLYTRSDYFIECLLRTSSVLSSS